MPYSAWEGKDEIGSWLQAIKEIDRVLDVGAGCGTYSNLFRKRFGKYWIGVEVHEPYVTTYELMSKYDRLIVSEVQQINLLELGKFSVTFCGDVYEHMHPSDAIQLHDRLLTISDWVIFSMPIIKYPQDAAYGNEYERHIKDDWTDEEIKRSFSFIKHSFKGQVVGCYASTTK